MSSEPKLDFKDVMIVPRSSDVKSRADVKLDRFICGNDFVSVQGIPICAANMDATGTFEMAKSLAPLGLFTALHKYYDASQLIDFAIENPNVLNKVFLTIGIQPNDYEKFKLTYHYLKSHQFMPYRLLCVDVANGYLKQVLDLISTIKSDYPDQLILAGNVVTPEGVRNLAQAGADIIKVGIGGGTACTTRRMTGIGYPQISAIEECTAEAYRLNVSIMSDGGCREPGDVVKAFAAGADMVMLGGMFAGTDECSGTWVYEQKPYDYRQMSFTSSSSYPRLPQVEYTDKKIAFKYYGMSSEKSMNKYCGGVSEHRTPEGQTAEVPYKGPVKNVVQQICGGLRSACTYTGSNSLHDFYNNSEFILVK
jgi:GMP reductase